MKTEKSKFDTNDIDKVLSQIPAHLNTLNLVNKWDFDEDFPGIVNQLEIMDIIVFSGDYIVLSKRGIDIQNAGGYIKYERLKAEERVHEFRSKKNSNRIAFAAVIVALLTLVYQYVQNETANDRIKMIENETRTLMNRIDSMKDENDAIQGERLNTEFDLKNRLEDLEKKLNPSAW